MDVFNCGTVSQIWFEPARWKCNLLVPNKLEPEVQIVLESWARACIDPSLKNLTSSPAELGTPFVLDVL
jgi:hypothetical protein